jgi:hypothetical protein
MSSTYKAAARASAGRAGNSVYGEDGKLRGQFIKKGQKREFILNPKARTLNYYKGAAEEANLRGVLNMRRFDYDRDVKDEPDKNRVEITASTIMENGALVKLEKPKVLSVSFAEPTARIRFCEGLATMSVDCHLGEVVLDGCTAFYILDLQQRTFEYYTEETYQNCIARLRLNKFSISTDIRQIDSRRIKLLGFCDVNLGESVLEGTDKAVSIETPTESSMEEFMDLLTELNFAIEQERRETQLHPNMATEVMQTSHFRSLALKNMVLRGRLHLVYACINGKSPRQQSSSKAGGIFGSGAASSIFGSSKGAGGITDSIHSDESAACEFWDAQRGFSFALKWGTELQKQSGEEGLTVYEQDRVELLTRRDEDRLRQLVGEDRYAYYNEEWSKQEAKVAGQAGQSTPFLVILKKPREDEQRVLLFLAAADEEDSTVLQWLKLFTSYLEARQEAGKGNRASVKGAPDRRRSHIVQELQQQMGRQEAGKGMVTLLDSPEEHQRVDLDAKGRYQQVEIVEGAGQQIVGGRVQDVGEQAVASDVSRCHFDLFYAKESDRFWLADLRSTNGTFVLLPAQRAGEHSRIHILATGHNFRVGAFEFRVEVLQPQRIDTDLTSLRHCRRVPAGTNTDLFFGEVAIDEGTVGSAEEQATPKLVLTCIKIPGAAGDSKVMNARWELTAPQLTELQELVIGSGANGKVGEVGEDSATVLFECIQLEHAAIGTRHCVIRYHESYGFGLVSLPGTSGTWLKMDAQLGPWPVPMEQPTEKAPSGGAHDELVFGLQAKASEDACYWYKCHVAAASQRARRLSVQLHSFFRVYNPAEEQGVDGLLESHAGREEALLEGIGRKYSLIAFFKKHNPAKVRPI